MVVAPGTEYRELARNRLDGSTLASMAVSDGALFIPTATTTSTGIDEQP